LLRNTHGEKEKRPSRQTGEEGRRPYLELTHDDLGEERKERKAYHPCAVWGEREKKESY